MGSIDFIIPHISGLFDFLSRVDVEVIVPTILAFFVGVFIRHRLNVRVLRELEAEIEDLRSRLRRARRLLYTEETGVHLGTGATNRGGEPQPYVPAQREDLGMRNTMETSPAEQSGEAGRTGDPPKIAPAEDKRMVRLVKVFGKENRSILPTTIIGFEETAPEVGQSYRIMQVSGYVFSTSPVITIGVGYIRTENSVYEIEPLN